MAGLSSIPVPWVRRLLLGWQWRQTRKRGRTLRLAVGSLGAFFKRLNDEGVRYVVLRWFNEVPLAQAAERPGREDVDVLAGSSQLETVVEAASMFPGPVKMDIYSPTGRRATAYKRMPYYPPVLAEEILRRRELHRGAFYVPDPEMHFKSL